ncbi:hypothetical protein MAE02_68530 [Microvirga aerophila]|uniref:Uncharacterized protein n=1 Tax=Microvirga aerophila TaxID=670291 RepID=A0A512C530_9HYPH|nr:hypothetical protein MAE02_68530 [Microvirga aerophila]
MAHGHWGARPSISLHWVVSYPQLARGGIMNVDTFEASLQHAEPPEGWSHALLAL